VPTGGQRATALEVEMAKKYVMKDLGYQRTPTDAQLRVEMPDGSYWDVPAQAIVDSRDEYYSDGEDTIGSIRAQTMRPYEVYGWAAGNMNWDEVEPYADKVDHPAPKVDYQDGWVNGTKTIKGEL
jgi:hypothetical protein